MSGSYAVKNVDSTPRVSHKLIKNPSISRTRRASYYVSNPSLTDTTSASERSLNVKDVPVSLLKDLGFNNRQISDKIFKGYEIETSEERMERQVTRSDKYSQKKVPLPLAIGLFCLMVTIAASVGAGTYYLNGVAMREETSGEIGDVYQAIGTTETGPRNTTDEGLRNISGILTTTNIATNTSVDTAGVPKNASGTVGIK